MATIGVPSRRTTQVFQDEGGQQVFKIPNWKGGYNSYAISRSLIADNEVSGGGNTRPDSNGAMSKRNGRTAASPALGSGNAISAIGILKKSGTFAKLAAVGTSVYKFDDGTSSVLTGATFTATTAENCGFTQAIGRTYFWNGLDQPYYTTDGLALTLQSGAFPFRYGQFYNQRLYCVRPTYQDRIYYSNPLSVDITTTGSEPSGYSAGNFGTYAVDLAANPIKNAGFIILLPDSGVVITQILKKTTLQGDSLHVYTVEHGVWEVIASTTVNANGTISHTVKQIIPSGGTPAPLSAFISANDEKFFGVDNLYKLGEAALYQSLRKDPESGRVQSDMRAIPATMRSKVAGIEFMGADYIAYGLGSYNDRVLVRDSILNAWSVPYTGWNVSCFCVVNEADGRKRLLAGSSDSTDPKIYELEVGNDDAGSPIVSSFRDKNSDCGHGGVVKYFGWSNIFYAQIIGSISYEVYVDGALVNSGTWYASQSGQASAVGSTVNSGVGTVATGQGVVGRDGLGSGGTLSIATDSYFTIEHDNYRGDKLEILYKDSTTGNTFKLLRRETYYELGDPQERLT